MAIEKDKAVHAGEKGQGTTNVINYITDEEKCTIAEKLHTSLEAVDRLNEQGLAELAASMGGVNNLLEYAENLQKTAFELDGDKEILISGVGCDPDTAAIEFQSDRQNYYEAHGENIPIIGTTYVDKNTGEIKTKRGVECYHVIQSFAEIEGLDPRLVHKIGIEYAEKAFPGHKCVVTTHMNTKHYHNHIVVCNYNSHEAKKFRMTSTKRREIRKLNDEISLNYGLPILIDNNMEHSTSLSYLEWQAQRNGDSWKDKIKSDMTINLELSKSWAEFIQRMKESGYGVKETRKYLTYSYLVGTVNGKEYGERKVRDKTLGEEFTRDYIMEHFGEKPEIEQPVIEHKQEQITEDKQQVSFFVSRWAPDGRRRTDIELIFLMAIKIIKYFMDKFFDQKRYEVVPDNPIFRPARIKLQAMQQSLYAAQAMGIATKEDLTERMNTVGAKLSHAKSQLETVEKNLKFTEQLVTTINEIAELEPQAAALGFDHDRLHIHEYDEETVYRNNAKDSPTSPHDRQKLFVLLEDNPQWKLKYKFDAISYQQANAIFDFLEHRTTTQPDCLITDKEFQIRNAEKKYIAIRNKQNKAMKDKYKGIVASEGILEKVKKYLTEAGIKIDLTDLSMYNAKSIVDYFEHRENPFYQGFIDSVQRDQLTALLSEKHMTLNRKINYVMKNEFEPLMSYLKTGKGYMPNLLKPAQSIPPSVKEQIEELMALKGEKCSIPIDELSQADGYELFSYLLRKDYIPEIIDIAPKVDVNVRHDYEFANELDGVKQEDAELLQVYRSLVNDLVAHGVDVKSLQSVLNDEKSYKTVQGMLKNEVETLGTEYKNLARLNLNLKLAEEPSFTRGPLFNDKEIEIAKQVQEKEEEIQQETKDEERQIEQEMEPVKEEARAKKSYWNGLGDSYFDRM